MPEIFPVTVAGSFEASLPGLAPKTRQDTGFCIDKDLACGICPICIKGPNEAVNTAATANPRAKNFGRAAGPLHNICEDAIK